MNRQVLVSMLKAASQGQARTVGGIFITIALTALSPLVSALTVLAIVFGALTLVLYIRDAVRFQRQARRLRVEERPSMMDPENVARLQSVVTVLADVKPPTGKRPPPVISLVQNLPNVSTVRLVMSPDVTSAEADARVVELKQLATTMFAGRVVDIKPMDVRLPAQAFDEVAELSLCNALLGMKQLPGLFVDITAGSKPMSITLTRAAENAEVPVTYMPQPPLGSSDTSFRGVTLLSDPHGWSIASGPGNDA